MRTAAVVVLCVNAFLLAWVEMAWLSYRVGAVPIPVSAVLALVTTPLLMAAAAAVGRSGFGVLAVWTLTVGVVGLWSRAGAGVMPQDWRAILLIAAGVLPGIVVAARRLPPVEGSERRAPSVS